ncbi:MAG TPA: sugar phosphate nucleotidyltransferase [Vicinamibacterales bacterium]|nr:sugar phosphate nucleotidyltransferase [Vicinamibacterales bacterium]
MTDDVVALVLARGLGRRMREAAGQEAGTLTAEQAVAASAGLKSMIPVAAPGERARPFLDYVLSELADAGFTRVALIVAPEGEAPDPLREYYLGNGRPTRISLSFIVQLEALGTADAVRAADAWVGTNPFVVLNADNLYGASTLRALRMADGPALPVYERDELVQSSAIPADRIASFALVTLRDGTLEDIVEKPGAAAIEAAGPRALISMNCWRGDSRLMDACRDVERSPRGEFELPMAVRLAVRRGVVFRGLPATGPVLDLSRRDDVRGVMERLAGVEARP